MESQNLTDITRAIQLSVAPAFLLVAMGTLITILNTRLGRIVDRRRKLQDSQIELTEALAAEANQELAVLNRRRTLIYFAILSAVLGALLICLVVAGTFLGALLSVELTKLIASLFVLTMGTMIVAWSLFLREVYIAVDKCTDSGLLRVARGSERRTLPSTDCESAPPKLHPDHDPS